MLFNFLKFRAQNDTSICNKYAIKHARQIVAAINNKLTN